MQLVRARMRLSHRHCGTWAGCRLRRPADGRQTSTRCDSAWHNEGAACPIHSI